VVTFLAAVSMVALVVRVVVLISAQGNIHHTLSGAPTGNGNLHGVVTDALTEQPVVAASIIAGGEHTTSDRSGVFVLRHPLAGSPLEISAPNYTTTTNTVTGDGLVLSLAPLPVRVTVLSSMTGAPLAATVEEFDVATAATDSTGVGTIYRVGPGDHLTVSAAGYHARLVDVDSSRTATAILEPTAETLISGSKKLTADQFDAMVDRKLPASSGFRFDRFQPPDRTRSGSWLANRTVDGVQAMAFVGVTETTDADFVYVEALIGPTAKSISIDGAEVWHGVGTDGIAKSLWIDGSLLIEIWGTSTAETDRILTGVINVDRR
jgi:hypothetical protein